MDLTTFDAAAQARNFMHTYESQKEEAARLIQESASQLEQKKITLIVVIESIGDYIKDEDATIRSKALHYLAGILENIPRNFLSRQQLDVICTFLVERIEDGGAVEGLLALQASTRFTNDMVTVTTRAVLQNLQDMQIRPQKQRHVIIKLVHELLDRYRSVVKAMGNEFLSGVIDLFSGEKDPRNLMLVFSVVIVVATEWDLGSHVESLFDSVFCYYPITFRPPPNDPYRITAADLKERLRQCLAASSRFAQFAFPQLLEKLDSGSANVKRDVFDTLKACINSYYPRTVADFAIKLWEALKYEVFHAQEEELADEALNVIEATTKSLCSADLKEIHGSDHLKKYLDTIIKECLDKLKEPQHKQAKSAARILAALVRSDQRAFDEVVKAVFPALLSLYEGAETIESRRSLLGCFYIILEAGVTVSQAHPRSRTDDIPLARFKDSLLEKFSQALMATTAEEMSYRILALSCLAKLSNISGVLLDEEVGLPVQYFNEIILTEDASGRSDLMNKAIDTLLELAESRYRVLLDVTIPKLLAELPDAGSTDVEKYQRSISILAKLSTKRELGDIIIRRLFARLDAALVNSVSAAYCEALLVALTYAIRSSSVPQQDSFQDYVPRVSALIKKAGHSAFEEKETMLTNVQVLRALGRLVLLILQRADAKSRSPIIEEIYSQYTSESILKHASNITLSRKKSIILSTYILAAIDKSKDTIPESLSDITQLTRDLLSIVLDTQQNELQHAFLQHLCLLINKLGDARAFEEAFHICTNIREQSKLDSPIRSKINTTSIVRVLMFLTKAQILRMSNTKQLVNYLLGLLDDDEWGPPVAAGFEVLLSKDEVLTKENGATIRLLAGQIIFTQVLEHINKVFPTVSTQSRPRYLTALGGILQHVDRRLALTNMTELNPLLLQSLNVPDPALKSATITTIAIAITENPESLGEHLSSIITQLLRIAIDRKANDASLRLKVMDCLRLMPGKFKEFALIPHIKAVDRGVVKVLDDPRRDVRKAAVDCRTAWLALDEPDEDE